MVAPTTVFGIAFGGVPTCIETGRVATGGGILNEPDLGLPTLGLALGCTLGAVFGDDGVFGGLAVSLVVFALIILTPTLPDLRSEEGGGGLFGTVFPTLGGVFVVS